MNDDRYTTYKCCDNSRKKKIKYSCWHFQKHDVKNSEAKSQVKDLLVHVLAYEIIEIPENVNMMSGFENLDI